MSEFTVEQLSEKVEKGRLWLAEHDHDPPGRFYLWWKSRIPASGKFGEHVSDEVRAAYATWSRALEMWLRLYAQLEAMSDA